MSLISGRRGCSGHCIGDDTGAISSLLQGHLLGSLCFLESVQQLLYHFVVLVVAHDLEGLRLLLSALVRRKL